ncbi:DUF6316 family protein [Microbulbifer taiwanensis]|uniref:DUF6316 family protein n=1 Tax=Microbulbifer taiwanensis TaxID=986746 RepID=A0ABW1YNR2_9GAMM|nr:DUF6316 family protein [Microbulbifer taiwanensis]
MQKYRAGEEGQPLPPRSDRFYKLGDDWYFQVRGGACFGPYPCRDEAERAVRFYFYPPRVTYGKQQKGAVIHPFGSQRAKHWRRNHKI